MPATDQNVQHWRGDTKVIIVPVKDDTGAFVDLDGGSARWWLGRNAGAAGDKVLVKKASIGSGGIVLQLEDGYWRARITIDPADTEGLKPGDYYHELEVIDADGAVSTVTTGTFTIVQTMIPPA
jgi:hypothetical protein